MGRTAVALLLVAAVAALVAAACRGSAPPAPPAQPASSASTASSAALQSAPAAGSRTDYPASRRDSVVEQVHGVAIADPYRWLEDPSQPEVQAWMKAQDDYARAR